MSLVPVQMSTLGFLIAEAILVRSAAGMPDFRLLAPDTPIDEAFSRTVFRSPRSALTLTPAWMCVVSVPPTFSVPTTVGFVSQWSGWMPSLDSEPEPEVEPVEVSCAKLDSSFWNVACGI